MIQASQVRIKAKEIICNMAPVVIVDNFTNTNDTSLLIYKVHYWEQILTAILILLVGLTGIIGNSMIILAVAFSRKLQTSTNALVTSLGITDFITAIFLIFYTVGVLGKNRWPIPPAYWLCELTAIMTYACTGTSLYTLGAIGVNRMVLIVKPRLYPRMFTSWKLILWVAIPWLIPGLATVIAITTGLGKFGYDPPDYACAAVHTEENDFSLSLYLGLLVTIPCFMIIISYSWIYIHLRKHFQSRRRSLLASSRHLRPSQSSQTDTSVTENAHDNPAVDVAHDLQLQQVQSKSPVTEDRVTQKKLTEERRKEVEITKNLFIVVCSFFVCFLPYIILGLFENHTVYHALFYTRIVTLSNCAINFFIYSSKHPEFKEVLKHMSKCSYQRIQQPSGFLKLLLNLRKT